MRRTRLRQSTAVGLAALMLLSLPAGSMAASSSATAQTVAVPAAPYPSSVPPGAMPAGPARMQAPKVTQEQAIELVKRYFYIPEGPGRLEAQLNNYGPRMSWQLMYTIDHANGSSGYGIGEVDAVTGKVLRFGAYGPAMRRIRTGPLGDPKPESYARSWAWALVRALYPEEAEHLQPVPAGMGPYAAPYGYDHDTYTFTWMKYHEGNPVLGSVISVGMDKYSLDYVSLQTNLEERLVFPAEEPSISQEEALAKFRESVRAQLVYQPISQPFGGAPTEMKLLYRISTPGILDAVSGEMVQANREPIKAGPPEPEAIPAAGVKPVVPPSLPLTQDQAIAYAEQLVNPSETARVNIQNDYPYGASSGSKALGIHWFDQSASAGVTIDPETGFIHNAYRSDHNARSYDPNRMAEVSPEQVAKAKQVAVELVQRYYSQYVSELKLVYEPVLYGGPSHYFFFQRHKDGVPVGYDGVRVQIDPDTLQWTNLNASWTTGLTFPDATQAISAEAAAARFFEGREAYLAWQRLAPPMEQPYGPQAPSGPRAMFLAYQLSAPDGLPMHAIEALTGESVDYSGRPVGAPSLVDQLLTDHWAEGELRLVLSSGALEASALDPGAGLSRADALRLLLQSIQEYTRWGSGRDMEMPYTDLEPGSRYFGLVQEALRKGMLKPEGDAPVFGGEEPLTRGEFAVWLVRLLGLGDLARSNLRAETSLRDLVMLPAEQQNAVIFLEALGLAEPAKSFRGGEQLTQGEAAALTVRMLLHLQGQRK